jgi:hypothetical protein
MLQSKTRSGFPTSTSHLVKEIEFRKDIWVLTAIVFVVLLVSSCGSRVTDSYTKAISAADEGMVIQTIRTIVTAEEAYRATHDGYGTFDELTKAGLLDARFAGDAPNLKGYRYTISAGATGYSINADPEASDKQRATGGRHFFVDSSDGVIKANATQPAGAGDPPH